MKPEDMVLVSVDEWAGSRPGRFVSTTDVTTQLASAFATPAE